MSTPHPCHRDDCPGTCAYVDDEYGSLGQGGSYKVYRCDRCGNVTYIPLPRRRRPHRPTEPKENPMTDEDDITMTFTRDEVAVMLLEPGTHLTDEQIAAADSVTQKLVDAYGRRRLHAAATAQLIETLRPGGAPPPGDRIDYRPAPLPRAAVPTVLGSLFLTVGAFMAFGLWAAVFVGLAAVMGWASGVLHERYAGR